MFPWSSWFTPGRWQAFDQVMSFASTILQWDVVRYTLAAVTGMALVGYLIGRVRRIGGA